MLNEFTYELIDEEAGLQPILNEVAYLKLPPAVRAKYRIKDEALPISDDAIELKESDGDLYDEHPEFDEGKNIAKKILYESPDYDEFEGFNSKRGGRATRGFNNDED